jgi:methyl-accepting chemotaxis protein
MSNVSLSAQAENLLNSIQIDNTQHRFRLLRQAIFLFLIVNISSAVLSFLLAWLLDNSNFFLLLPALALGLFASPGLWWLSRVNLDVCTWVLIILEGTIVSCVTILYGTQTPVIAAFLWLPFMAGLLGRNRSRDVLITSGVTALLMVALIVLERGFAWLKPQIILSDTFIFSICIWVGILGLMSVGMLAFTSSLQQASQQSDLKARQLSIALTHIADNGSVVQEVNHMVLDLTRELASNAEQQFSGASSQAVAIIETTSSLEELGETAQHISKNAGLVSQAATQSLTLAHEVETRSEYLNNLTRQGQAAVNAVLVAIEAVRNRIESLAQRLLQLTERSKEIGNIVDLMRDIADETHMLALNAAIESADNKMGGGNDSGRRFGVIAGEVKNLADRSLESTQDVQKIILEVQGAIATAVLAAEEGKKETLKAVNQAFTSGQVIQDLGQAAAAAVQSSLQIVEAVTLVGTLSEEITLATRQQGSANEQIVLTMRTILEVADSSAKGVGQVAQTAQQIEALVNQIEIALSDDDFVAL